MTCFCSPTNLSPFWKHFLAPSQPVNQPPTSPSTDLHNGGDCDLIRAPTLSHAHLLRAKHHFCAPLFRHVRPPFRLRFHRCCRSCIPTLSLKFGVIQCWFGSYPLFSFFVQPLFMMNIIKQLLYPCVTDFPTPFHQSSPSTTVSHHRRPQCRPHAQKTQNIVEHDLAQGPSVWSSRTRRVMHVRQASYRSPSSLRAFIGCHWAMLSSATTQLKHRKG